MANRSRNEFELKVLDINPGEVRQKLRKLKAKRVAFIKYRRIVFLIKGKKGQKIWIRLRTDGKKHTMTLKDSRGWSISSMKEYEVKISDFKEAARILAKALPRNFYEENTRELYKIGDTEITIDKYPFIPPFVEIEAKTVEGVERMFRKLNITGKRFGNAPGGEVYTYYGLDNWKIHSRHNKKLKKLLQG